MFLTVQVLDTSERRKRGMMGKSAKQELGLPTGGGIMGWLLGLHMNRKENRVPLASPLPPLFCIINQTIRKISDRERLQTRQLWSPQPVRIMYENSQCRTVLFRNESKVVGSRCSYTKLKINHENGGELKQKNCIYNCSFRRRQHTSLFFFFLIQTSAINCLAKWLLQLYFYHFHTEPRRWKFIHI